LATEASHHAIETMFLEERTYPPPEDFAAQANAQPGIYDVPFEEFWEREGRERVTWFERFTELYQWEPPYAKWYLGGKLNVCFNCVDRHVEAGAGGVVAYHWEGEPEGDTRTITYADLQKDVVRFANALKKLGVKKGTPVGIYMGMVPELPVAMLACTRLGAPHTVVFGGFSADSLSGRMNDMKCELIITQDEAWRRGSTIGLKTVADEAMCRCRRAVTTGGTTSPATPRTIPIRVRASRWTARTCCSSCTRAERPRSRRGSSTRRPATSSARRRRTTTSST
jgi:acetyl-CoA synthetase